MRQVMASGTFEWPEKKHKMVSDGSESTTFQYYMKRSSIYILVPVLSLGSVRLHIMCIGTIAGWKSTESSIALC